MNKNIELVKAFITTFNNIDVEAAIDLMSDDCIYHNIPVDPVQGKEQIRATLNMFMGLATEVDWVINNIMCEGDVVLTERLDRFLIKDNWLELPVMGAFEIRDNKIYRWRDYFDMNQFQSQLTG